MIKVTLGGPSHQGRYHAAPYLSRQPLGKLNNQRFDRTLRREVLNAEWFRSINQALGMRPPVPEALSKSGP